MKSTAEKNSTPTGTTAAPDMMRNPRTKRCFSDAITSHCIALWASGFATGFVFAEPADSLKTISLTLRTRTGGEISGAVIDHNEHGIVLLHEQTPYVFAWMELEGSSAYAARRSLINFVHGDKWTADHHFELGRYCLKAGRNDLAANEFRMARKLNADLAPRIQEAFDRFRQSRSPKERADRFPRVEPQGTQETDAEGLIGDDETPTVATQSGQPIADFAKLPSDQVRGRVREAYLQFGEKVRERLGKDIALIESDHFLIWTDWEKKDRNRLMEWSEAMYSALADRFGADPKVDLFLAKCPVFCFQTKARFRKFARDFDGYDGANAIGYTRSIPDNGHVHMVIARDGRALADYDRFACTLVHEGTHAFLHRFHGGALLPHWVNEGFADLTAAAVLGVQCPNAGNAALLARQYVRFDWSIASLLQSTSTIEVHQYALAHSVVASLERIDRGQLAEFIKSLKGGSTIEQALADSFDGLTIGEFERRWKDEIRRSDPFFANAMTAREASEERPAE